MYRVEEALGQILQGLSPLPVEHVPLTACLGRVLAEEVAADIPMPPFTNSAVDGYAVRAENTAGATAHLPAALLCVGEVPAGVWPDKILNDGECMRIMTGAPLPAGADAVVMVEDTTLLAPDRIILYEPARYGQHVRYAGEDIQVGDRVLLAGTPVRSAEIGLLAQMGRVHVPVFRLPRVAVLSTGDEVMALEEGGVPPPGKIRNSNSYALAAQVQEAGALVDSRLHVPDDLAATQAALRQCALSEVDVIVTAGGVSVGDRDFVKAALETLGTLELWRVAMKPGKPLAFGHIGRTLFFGLPGNPVSAQITFELFVRPALWKLAGRPEDLLSRRQVEATVLEPIPHLPGRREYLRAITEWQDGKFVARPAGGQSSANMYSLARANSLLIVPEASPGVNAGEILPVLLLA